VLNNPLDRIVVVENGHWLLNQIPHDPKPGHKLVEGLEKFKKNNNSDQWIYQMKYLHGATTRS
jgi:hypothetical protein